MTYLNVVEVETATINLAAAYPSLTQLITLPNTTVEGRTSHAIRTRCRRPWLPRGRDDHLRSPCT